ncbi:MAG: YicC family protein [Halioglobus sp.]|nr:YicC family protein [Halioglobus sp.]
MIQSMTAFARESTQTEAGILTVELRSVNHRYLDCSFKLPETLRSTEPQLREKAAAALARGKLDCIIRLQPNPSLPGDLQIDSDRLDALLSAVRQVQKRLGDPAPLNPLHVMQFPGVCFTPEDSAQRLQEDALSLFDESLQNLQEHRQREGSKLAGLVLDRLTPVEREVQAARDALPQLIQRQLDRIRARIADLGTDADQGRLEQELVYVAQRADVEEELDRLDAHVAEVRHTLQKGGPCGRRLDFLMQELNREANTLSSKSLSASTTQNAVELKVLIEQMREQIQNIE